MQKPIKKIRQKTTEVKDPPRFPKVIIPMEKSMKDGYVKMLNNMVRMVEVGLGVNYKSKQ